MSDKPNKVYQGVRVKTTVKELLRRQRASQAAIKTVSKSQGMTSPPDVSYTLLTDLFSRMPAPETCVQPRAVADNVYSFPVENTYENQQFMNVMPAENFNTCSSNTSVVCSTPSAQHWSNGCLPSTMDYYSNNLVSSSPSDSYNLPSPVDYNSYSPHQSHSASSSCYNSPTRMDLGCGFAQDNYHYQHCNLQHCLGLTHWSGFQENMQSSDYVSYGTSDCLYSSVGEDNYLRSNTFSSELCYL